MQDTLPLNDISCTRAMEIILQQARHISTHSLHAVMVELRILKGQMALVTALADLANIWPMERVTEQLSHFADIALHKAFETSTKALKTQGILDSETAGMALYAVGKLGSMELNYSSDIDILFLYDPNHIHYTGRLSLPQQMVAVIQQVHHILSQQTEDGYVFRVDLRLRPDPGSTQSAISLNFAQKYYSQRGQNWERAAMTKARFVCGCTEIKHDFDTIMEDFIWRKELDYTAQQDILAIQRQIAHRSKAKRSQYGGFNVKLGHGGIRDIEFLLQIQQLLWGGRDPSLRVTRTKPLTQALVQAGLLEAETGKHLWKSYCFYRNIEHRLQMVDDQQTHLLPDDDSAMDRIALTLNLPTQDALRTALAAHITCVEQAYHQLVGPDASNLAHNASNYSGNLVFTGVEDDPETLQTLREMGYDDPAFVSRTVRGWHHGRMGATKNAEARAMLTALMPLLLQHFANTLKPDTAFAHFNAFLTHADEELRIFHLIHANPDIVPLLATSLGHYPFMARYLINSPHVADELVGSQHYEAMDDHVTPQQAPFTAETLVWQACNARFDVALKRVRDQAGFASISASLTDVANHILHEALITVQAEIVANYGHIDDGQFAILGMGKLGANEMTFGSDLDIIYIYHAPENARSHGTAHSLNAGDYYVKIASRLNGLLSASTSLGRLYDVDLRLRPNGEKSSLATRLESLFHYYSHDAWAWEHMALTRGRMICGDTHLCHQLDTWLNTQKQTIYQRKDINWKLLEIHKKTHRQFTSSEPLNIKYIPGGLLDVEYIVQSLLLCSTASRYGSDMHGQIATLTDVNALSQAQSQILTDAHQLYNEIITCLRLMGISTRAVKSQDPKFRQILISQLQDYQSYEALHKALVSTQKNVQKIFEQVFREI